jgi:deoxyhypusine synthase
MSIIPQPSNNYQVLLQDCQQIITEFGFTHRWALIELYWTLGKRINEEKSVTVTQLATDLGKNVRTIQIYFLKVKI